MDEDLANLYCLCGQAERKKIMTRKLKLRVSAMIMCAALFVTSMVVWAATWKTESESVELDSTGMGTAKIQIYSSGSSAKASTTGTSLYSDPLATTLNGYGTTDSVTGTGGTTVQILAEESMFTYATSKHKWTGKTHYMNIYR